VTLARAAGAAFVILAWGDLVFALLASRWLPPSRGLRAALSWTFGCGTVSWVLFVGLWSGLSVATMVTGLSVSGVAIWLGSRRHLRQSKAGVATRRTSGQSRFEVFNPLAATFAAILVAQIGVTVFAALVSPLSDWDAWVNWASKANVIFATQTLSPDVYNNLARLPTNLDYPLMLPLLEVWFYAWLGQIHEPMAGLISTSFYLALLLAFFHSVRKIVSPTTALGFTMLLATIPRLERLAPSGLADVPLASLVFVTFLLVYYDSKHQPADRPWPRALMLALATGLLPWLKNEGWLWLGLISLSWLGWRWRELYRRERTATQTTVAILTFALTVLVVSAAWPLFLALHGTQRFTYLPFNLATLLANVDRVPAIFSALFGRLANPYWNFVWLLVGLALLFRRDKLLAAPAGWLILPVTAYILGVAAIYIFSRFDPYLAHLNNSAERLLAQAPPLVWWWLAGQSVAAGWVRRGAS
jgi:hypothetical protein